MSYHSIPFKKPSVALILTFVCYVVLSDHPFLVAPVHHYNVKYSENLFKHPKMH